MNPYLLAHQKYLTHTPHEHTWAAALDIHLQAGAVISTPAAFVMARPVSRTWPREFHPDLSYIHPYPSPTWHIYAAAGSLSALMQLAREHQIQSVTYQRRARQTIHFLAIPSI